MVAIDGWGAGFRRLVLKDTEVPDGGDDNRAFGCRMVGDGHRGINRAATDHTTRQYQNGGGGKDQVVLFHGFGFWGGVVDWHGRPATVRTAQAAGETHAVSTGR